MMNLDDAEIPVFYTASYPAGRRRYRCCECGAEIPAGERHEHVRGFWTGGIGFAAWRTCRRCVAVRGWASAQDVEAPFEGLEEALGEAGMLDEARRLAGDVDWVEARFERVAGAGTNTDGHGRARTGTDGDVSGQADGVRTDG